MYNKYYNYNYFILFVLFNFFLDYLFNFGLLFNKLFYYFVI